MTKKPLPRLPDLEDDDAVFQRKIQPLIEKALPNDRKRGTPAFRISGIPSIRSAGIVEAAQALQQIEAKRGSKRRFEYLIPERVGYALAEDAAKRGVSATTRLLEVLRDSGYPVIPEDLVDLRKLPKR